MQRRVVDNAANHATPVAPPVAARRPVGPRVVLRTVSIDDMLANKAVENGGSQELQNVQKFVTWLFNHISGHEPQSEVIVAVTNFNTDMVTYLYNLDHATHPILGGAKQDYLFEFHHRVYGDHSAQNALYRLGMRCEARVRDDALEEEARLAELREERGKEN
ncbi:hypothetical protein CAEBREN_21354 [Caenorhabditis brenneri]|uniref:Uncharacterized protein n=1 Tax=Caenorhabditis brenneri TaxID=135651 RepID=G0PBG7_CAEBE|nr:hypothetical protein CAEBREN_21354 [Caenorhabditis brenneri]